MTFENPSISKSTQVIVRLALVRTFGVVGAGYNCRVTVQIDLDILNTHCSRPELGITDVRQKLVAVRDLTVPLCVDESFSDHFFKGARITQQLPLVPHLFQREQLVLRRIDLWADVLPYQAGYKQNTG